MSEQSNMSEPFMENCIISQVQCVFVLCKKSETQNGPTLKHYSSTMLIVSRWMFLSHDLVSNGALTKGDILHL